MNRIELIRALRQEVGYSGSGPSTSANATGQTKELVDRVDQAWLDLQTMSLWDWQWEQATIVIPAGQSVSAPQGVTNNRYVIDSLRSPDGPVSHLTWRDFVEAFDPPFSEGMPSAWAVRPDTAIAVNAVAPAGGVQLNVERYRNPTPFAADTDVPSLPSEYHYLIVWLATMRIAAFDEAGARYMTAKREFDTMFNRLQSETVAQMQLGEPLA